MDGNKWFIGCRRLSKARPLSSRHPPTQPAVSHGAIEEPLKYQIVAHDALAAAQSAFLVTGRDRLVGWAGAVSCVDIIYWFYA